jgi:hypothetical protein
VYEDNIFLWDKQFFGCTNSKNLQWTSSSAPVSFCCKQLDSFSAEISGERLTLSGERKQSPCRRLQVEGSLAPRAVDQADWQVSRTSGGYAAVPLAFSRSKIKR